MKQFIRLTFLISFLLPAICSIANAAPWSVNFTGANGISLSYNGVPIIFKSTLYVMKPGWTGGLYNQRTDKQEVQKKPDGALHVSGSSDYFHAEYELRALDAQTFEIHFRGELTQDVPAQIELNEGFFNANPIANRPFEATPRNADKSTFTGVVPAYPAKEGLAVNNLSPDFQTLNFDSRLGKVSIKVLSPRPAIFADGRRYPHLRSEKTPFFWLGWMAGTQPLKKGEPLETTVTIHIEPSDANANEPLSIQPKITPVADVFKMDNRQIQIVPKPKEMTVDAAKHFSITNATPWSVIAPAGETRLAAAVQRLMSGEWNITLPAPNSIKSTFNGWCGIRLGDNKPISITPEMINAAWAKHQDSYRLIVDKTGMTIVSPTARGAFYGVQTLAQMLRSDDKTVNAPFAEIEDWPTLQFRGAHWFPSQSGVPFDKKLIEIMARNKMNYAVIQCEAARWDSHPEIAAPDSISKKDLQNLVDWCRANFIEPIPLIDQPGHATWMFRNNQNIDLAEDPKLPYAYSVNNPKAIQFVRDVMNEAIAIFHPKIFCIGSDEANMRGRFPNPDNPLNAKDETVSSLLLKNLDVQHQWLADQGIKTMIWGDMFLNKDEGASSANASSIEEAKTRRAAIPKDVIVADWHYNNSEKYPSLKLFQKEGLQTIAATWYRPENIRNFTQAAIADNAWGVLQTTWAGFFPNDKTLDTESRQFIAFILAADYSWSGRAESLDQLSYDAAKIWAKSYAPQSLATRSGALIDISATAQVPAKNWLGLGEGWDLNSFFDSPNQAAPRRFDGVDFRLSDQRFAVLSSAPAAMAPAGALKELTININHTAGEIAFLHSTLWKVDDGTAAARCIVEYTDGTKKEIDFSSPKNIAPWQDDTVTANAVSAWKGNSPANTPLHLYLFRWQNPQPEKTIARLIFQPVDAQAGYILAGLSLVD